MTLRSIQPLLKHLRRVDINTDVTKGFGKAACEETQVHYIVEICICTVSKPLKGSDVFVDAAFFHFQLFEFVCGTLVFHIVNEGILEVVLKDLPGSHTKGD